jgi:hypothetical protein
MIFTQLYAAAIVPAILAWSSFRLTTHFGVNLLVSLGAALLIFLASAWLGYEVEHHYFREVSEGKAKYPRLFVFLLGLPLIYGASLLLGAGVHVLFPELSASVPIAASLAALASGMCLLLHDNHHRGRRLFTERYVSRIARAELPEGDEGIPLGRVPIPTEKACTHICFVGTTGSGKTTAIKRVMDTVLRSIAGAAFSSRALVYDPKTEFFGWLSAQAPCYTINPFDRRGRAWQMCKDIRTPKAAAQFAFTLIPQEHGNNAFFSNGARAVFGALVESFILNSPDDWTFADLHNARDSKERLRELLARNDITKSVITKYLDAKECGSLLTTLDTYLNPFRPIAACWAKAEPISLSEWVDGNFVLILPQDETARAPLGLLNGLIFEFLTQQLLGYKTNEQLKAEGRRPRRTYLFLDELRDIADTLNKPLTSILTRGRAWGISCISGWQSQSGLIDAINQNRGPEVFGMHSYIGMLRVQEKETAEHLSRLCGDRDVYRDSGAGKPHLATEHVVLPTDFSELGTNPIETYFLAPPPLGLWKGVVPFPEKRIKNVDIQPDFLPRPESDQYLLPWTKEDLERLKLPLSLLDDPKSPDDQHQPARPNPNGPRRPSGLQVVDLRDRSRQAPAPTPQQQSG